MKKIKSYSPEEGRKDIIAIIRLIACNVKN